MIPCNVWHFTLNLEEIDYSKDTFWSKYALLRECFNYKQYEDLNWIHSYFKRWV